MQDKSDAQLLRDYADHGSEAAFREIVERHTGLVYSAALRCVNSSDLACDLAQGVFTDLARKARPLAGKLSADASLVGWLYRSTRFATLNQLRDDHRRLANERLAMEQLLSNSDPTPDWERIRPVLDEAMDELKDEDREALLLRYFKNHDFHDIGLALGVSEDAAQKRVSRAVDRLREFYAQRGVTVGVGGLAVVLSANAIQAAPVGLAASISSAALLTGTTLAATATVTATTKVIAMTLLQKTLITATLTAALGTGIYEARQASTLRGQVQTLQQLQQQQAPLAAEMAGLKAENERLSNQVVLARSAATLPQEQMAELLKLRGATTAVQSDSREIARLKSSLAQQTGKMPDYLSNILASSMSTSEESEKKSALARLARMKKFLDLNNDQELSMSNLLVAQARRQSELSYDLLMGKSTPAELRAQLGSHNPESEIKAMLTPAQLAAYPDFLKEERNNAADASARFDAAQIADDFMLTKEQQDKLHQSLLENSLKPPANAPSQEAAMRATESGNLGDIADIAVQSQQAQLEGKMKILEGFLSPEQLNTYRDVQTKRLQTQATAMKAFLPQKSAAPSN